MLLDQWAEKWNISLQAIEDLKKQMGLLQTVITNNNEQSEQGIQSLIRLEATKKGCRLWRNNVGAAYTREGNFIRYGLANESSALNKKIKSADLIGIRPVKITPYMIGWTIGQFVSREVKAANWRYRGDDREQAQLKWAELIMSYGGDACFTNREGTL